MRKLSVFYEHILQACEQSGKTIPEVLAFCREQGISAVEMNYSLFASEREVIAPMLSDAGLVISCMHETFDFSHDTDLGRAQQMLDTAASQQVSRVLFVAGALETAEAAELAACSSTYEYFYGQKQIDSKYGTCAFLTRRICGFTWRFDYLRGL